MPRLGAFSLLAEREGQRSAGHGRCVVVDRAAACLDLAGTVLVVSREVLEADVEALEARRCDACSVAGFVRSGEDRFEAVEVALWRTQDPLAVQRIG